ncbi:hypothetical protein C5C71_16630 [Rathayibacter sp. AY1C1]|jgi:hypothetical protein|uniref:hypothetical protein n=1 Tax=Rathayibacter sp. AY1C1 TaxID=2080534 RepID=UPI000CE85605|nr:hypothetical protein [Rathayibacter sp. AY1C1]PPH05146.1 hypothetical protein C5C71_16630 [Rathayibacter sp. AY1C1]
MQALALIALVILAVVFVARIPAAVSQPSSRLSWLASGVGSLALLTRVHPGLDRFIGGENYINLAQNLLATTAFWLVMRAALLQSRSTPRFWTRKLILVAMLVSFAVPFLFITDKEPTSETFITEHITQTSTWLYASIYMTAILAISTMLLLGLRRRQARSYGFFVAGSSLVILACIDEIVVLALDHFEVTDLGFRILLRNAFDSLFYCGVILIVTGIASFTLQKAMREARLGRHARRLRRLATRLAVMPPTNGSHGTQDESAIAVVYDLVIALRDFENAHRGRLTVADARHVAEAEAIVMEQLPSPATTKAWT